MKELIIQYAGDSANYEVVVTDRPRMSCSCPAGQNFTLCKHRLALLEGDVSKCVGLSDNDASILDACLKSPAFDEIRSLLEELHGFEAAIAALKKKMNACKRKLGNRLG